MFKGARNALPPISAPSQPAAEPNEAPASLIRFRGTPTRLAILGALIAIAVLAAQAHHAQLEKKQESVLAQLRGSHGLESGGDAREYRAEEHMALKLSIDSAHSSYAAQQSGPLTFPAGALPYADSAMTRPSEIAELDAQTILGPALPDSPDPFDPDLAIRSELPAPRLEQVRVAGIQSRPTGWDPGPEFTLRTVSADDPVERSQYNLIAATLGDVWQMIGGRALAAAPGRTASVPSRVERVAYEAAPSRQVGVQLRFVDRVVFGDEASTLRSIDYSRIWQLAVQIAGTRREVRVAAYGGERGAISGAAHLLSQQRGEAIRRILIEGGVNPARISVLALGGARDIGPAQRADVFVTAGTGETEVAASNY